MTTKQTAGREQLGEFAPQFAALNDDVLFGEVWADEQALSAHDRSMITIAALIAMGSTEQLDAHLNIGERHHQGRDSGGNYPSGLLRRLAEGLVGFQPRQANLAK